MKISKIFKLFAISVLSGSLILTCGCGGSSDKTSADAGSSSDIASNTLSTDIGTSSKQTASRLTEEQIALTRYLGNWSNKISDIEKAQNGKFTFAIQTDTHFYDLTNENAARNMASMSNFVKLEFIANLGDIVRGYSVQDVDSPENMRACMIDLVNRYTENAKCPVFMTVGNHDTNIMWCQKWADHTAQITPQEQYEMIYSPLKAFNGDAMVTDDDGSYYYMDFPDDKVRIIMLNTANGEYDGTKYSNTFTISDRQAEWFKNQALKTDFSVIVMSHVPMTASFPDNGNGVHNSDKILAAVDSFVSGGGSFIAYMYGHTHAQHVVVEEDTGRLHISFKDGGSYGEIVMIDLENKTIETIGLGGVGDREFRYN